MTADSPSHAPQGPELRGELAAMLASRAFSRAPRLRAMLAHVLESAADGRTSALRETSIALDVFNCDPSTFDPAHDPIVRVSANRLRGVIDRYYRDEGAARALRIELPPGGYVPVLRRAAPATLPALPRIAVLPLRAIGATVDEMACDGLTEDLIEVLARRADVRVTARASSFRYRDRPSDARRAARELGVDAVLEGEIVQSDGRLRVSARLVLGSDGTCLWRHVFEESTDARHLLTSRLVELMLRSVQREPPAGGTIVVPAADVGVRALVDRARHLRHTNSPENIAHAVTLLERASALAPDFVDAWLQLAIGRMWQLASWDNREVEPAAVRTPLGRALALDPSNGPAIALDAYLSLLADHDWSRALALAARARELAPHDTDVLQINAMVLHTLARYDEAEEILALAIALDPSSPRPRWWQAFAVLARDGDFERAMAIVDEAERVIGPSPVMTDRRIAVQLIAGRHADAELAARAILARQPDSIFAGVRLAQALAGQGRLAEARALVATHVSDHLKQAELLRAVVEAAGPDLDAFFAHALRAVQRHDANAALLPVEPLCARARRDPRWRAIAAALHYPDAGPPIAPASRAA